MLVRTDGAGATHAFLDWLARQRVSYSVGFSLLPYDAEHVLAQVPAAVWTPAYDADGQVRDGAYVAELTGLLNLASWPAGMRVIARKERPHPGAQLTLTDVDGMRVTAFATNTCSGQLPDLELRHRRRARAEDRIRICKDTGLTNLPLHGFDQNRIWCALVMLAVELIAWMQLLALHHHQARRWEPKKLRYRVQCPGRARPHRPTRPAASGRQVAVGSARRRRRQPASRSRRSRLSRSHPDPTTQPNPGTVEAAPHRATSAEPSHS